MEFAHEAQEVQEVQEPNSPNFSFSHSFFCFRKKKNNNQKCYRITDGLNIQLCMMKEEEEEAKAKNQFTSVVLLLLLLLTTLLHLLFTIHTYDACV